MEYIECTHCGKRYAANEKIQAVEGSFVRCKSCLEKFMIVIHDSKKRGIDSDDDRFLATGDWDPTVTIAPDSKQAMLEEIAVTQPRDSSLHEDDSVIDWSPSATMPSEGFEYPDDENDEPLSDEEIKAKAEASLASIKAAKKKKTLLMGLLVIVLVLLALTLYMAFSDDSDNAQNTAVNQSDAKALKPEEIDAKNKTCKDLAARQWMLDFKAMHEGYSGEEFVSMLDESDTLQAQVRANCKAPLVLNQIIDSATSGEIPEWLASEIQALKSK